MAFGVTPKRSDGSAAASTSGRALWVLVSASALAVAAGAAALVGYGPARHLDPVLIVTSFGWALFSSVQLWGASALFRSRPLERDAHRFRWPIPIAYRVERTGGMHVAIARDVGLSGVGFIATGDVQTGDKLDVMLRLEGQKPLRFRGVVRHASGLGASVGVEFVDVDRRLRDTLLLTLVTYGASRQDKAEATRWEEVYGRIVA